MRIFKEVLLQTAILRVLEDQEKVLRLSIAVKTAAGLTLTSLADQVISALVLSYRVNAGLLRAVRQLLQDNEGTAFWQKASKLELRTFEYLVDIFTSGRSEIKHADPRVAVSLGLVMVMGTLWEVIVLPGDAKQWKILLPKDDRSLKLELTRAFLSYLGVSQL